MLSLIPRDHWEHHFGDVLRGLAAACSPSKQPLVLDLPGLGPCLPARSGRVALVTVLQALDLPRGAQVGVPLFCCPIVFDAIAAANCVPRFLDVDPTSFCLSPAEVAARIGGLDAVIAVHIFGNTCDMPALREAAGDKPIIEDCAQALGSRIGDRPVGSFGSFGVFSFRAAKYLSVGEGGALCSRHADLRARARELARSLPGATIGREFKHVASGYSKALLRSQPLYAFIGYRLWNAWNAEKTSGPAPRITPGRIFKADLALAVKRLNSLPSMIQRQRALADFYTGHLKLDPAMFCAEKSGAYWNRYLYPVTLPSRLQRDRFATLLHDRGIDTMKYLDQVVPVAAMRYGYSGDCPVAEQLSRQVLTIPCHHGLTQKNAEHVCRQVNAAWQQLRRECAGADSWPLPQPRILTESSA